MHVSARSLLGLAAGAVLLLAALPLPDARADATKGGSQLTVTLKDGFVLQGMDRREGKYELEEDGVEIFMPSGFFFLDDMPRRQYFSAALMQTVAPKAESTEDKIYAKYHDIRIIHPRKVPNVQEVLSVGAWDDKWGRDVKFRADDGRDWTVNQRLAVLTPYYAYTLATDNWNWPAMYLTRELGPDAVRNLLSSHPDFQLDNNLAPADLAARHFRYCDFFAQAGWYDESERELDRLLAENPSDDVKQKVEATRAALNRLRGREWFETDQAAAQRRRVPDGSQGAGQFQRQDRRPADGRRGRRQARRVRRRRQGDGRGEAVPRRPGGTPGRRNARRRSQGGGRDHPRRPGAGQPRPAGGLFGSGPAGGTPARRRPDSLRGAGGTAVAGGDGLDGEPGEPRPGRGREAVGRPPVRAEISRLRRRRPQSSAERLPFP